MRRYPGMEDVPPGARILQRFYENHFMQPSGLELPDGSQPERRPPIRQSF